MSEITRIHDVMIHQFWFRTLCNRYFHNDAKILVLIIDNDPILCHNQIIKDNKSTSVPPSPYGLLWFASSPMCVGTLYHLLDDNGILILYHAIVLQEAIDSLLFIAEHKQKDKKWIVILGFALKLAKLHIATMVFNHPR
jgi:hypothetical protein